MIKRNTDKYKLVDRRHLKKILEEQKLSMSGLTESESVKLGKLLNLDIIVLRIYYEESQVTKVLKVDTGEVLLIKTYNNPDTETKKVTEKDEKEGWIFYRESKVGDFYYNKNSLTNVTPKIFKVWVKNKYSKYGKDERISLIKDFEKSKDVWEKWEKIDNEITLYELDCVNNTFKGIKIQDYNDKGDVLMNIDVPSGVAPN